VSATESKVNAILDQLRPYVEAEGGTITLDRIDGPVVRLHMRGPDSRCSSLLVFQKLAVERRIVSELNEIERVEISAGLAPVEDQNPGD